MMMTMKEALEYVSKFDGMVFKDQYVSKYTSNDSEEAENKCIGLLAKFGFTVINVTDTRTTMRLTNKDFSYIEVSFFRHLEKSNKGRDYNDIVCGFRKSEGRLSINPETGRPWMVYR